MRACKTICAIVLPLLIAASAAEPADRAMRMSIPQEAIYTPGCVRVDLTATRTALLAESYRVKITASVAGETIHARTMTLTRSERISCELPFSAVRAVTEARCRAELFQGDEFIEMREKPIRLWPPRRPRKAAAPRGEFWAFDPSGVVQKLLAESGITASDAAFQAVRDFGAPRVVVVGERLDPSGVQRILDRVAMTDENTVVVLLEQERFPESLQVSIKTERAPSDGVVRDRSSVLLEGITARDVMGLLDGARVIHVKELPGRIVASFLTGGTQSEGETSSYLCAIHEGNRRILCCQLPAADNEDPRQMMLFQNLVQFACEASDTERVDP